MAAMHTALQSVVKYFKITKSRTHVNDVGLSQVQYKFVFGALVTCAILSGLTTWFSRIECALSEVTTVEKKFIEEWCYANSTFVVKQAHNGYVVGNQFDTTSESVFHVSYYQWITIAMLLQAACFQLPRLLWKFFEGGRVRKMLAKLPELDPASPECTALIENAARIYVDKDRRRSREHYFTSFAVCQYLYFFNALLQICFTQMFLNNEFLSLFPFFLLGEPSWNQVFPRRVKCDYFVHSPGGVLQPLNVLCHLPMNVLFEKLYLFIWIMLAVALFAAIAQSVLVFKYIVESTSHKHDQNRSASDRLLLKFLESSLDRELYARLIRAINQSGAMSV